MLTALVLLKPFAQSGVNLLRLLWSSDFAGSDGPDGLVGQDDLAPVRDLISDGFELGETDLLSLSGFPFLQLLADAGNDVESGVQGELNFVTDQLVGLAENVSSLAVAENDPIASTILDHVT